VMPQGTIHEDTTIPSLIRRAWEEYEREAAAAVRVMPGMPVAWFGDLVAYNNSPLRVITVGLNPSRLEFPADSPFSRFRAALTAGEVPRESAYLLALNNYFAERPYIRWFRSFEAVLNGLSASYGFGDRPFPNRALHTDICSPVPTDPTWSRLSGEVRNALAESGAKFWLDLVEHLRPDVVIMSFARRYVSVVSNRPLDAWEVVVTIERKNPFRAFGTGIVSTSGHPSLAIFGQAANTPFGTLSWADRVEVGRGVLRTVERGFR
jgi:hypothetical protein